MLTFAAAVFLLIITPGPGVLSTAGVGAAFGWRQGLFYIGGLCAGTNLVGLTVISGLAAVLLAEPVVRTVLLFASSGYLGYLALRIALAGARIAFIRTTAPGFLAGLNTSVHQPQGLCGEYRAVQQLCLLSCQLCGRDRTEARHYEYHLAATPSCLALCRGKSEQPRPAATPATGDQPWDGGLSAGCGYIVGVVRREPAGE